MIGAVKGRPLDPYPMVGRLDNGILLGVKAPAEFMAFSGRDTQLFTKATDVQTVGETGRSPIVACGQDLLIFDQNGAHMSSQTGRAFGNEMGDIHEVFFPGRSVRMGDYAFFFFQRRNHWGMKIRMSNFEIRNKFETSISQ
jgi:hypothetical protein